MIAHDFDIPMQNAVHLSEVLRPPRWRVLAFRRWRKHQQPEQIQLAVFAAIRGEYEPIRRFGAQT